MLSMLHTVVAHGGDRPVWFVHGARDGEHHPFAEEVRTLAAARPNTSVHVTYSRPRLEDQLGRDFDSAGRVSGELLAGLAPPENAQYFLCGPTRLMADLQSALENQGVPSERIHTESFGPAA
jgi:ferredoxin-NADP reductase